ncbi:hypothetical protein K474DRAFT_1605519, partial [Panus rudis PR-1116 ss-1]
DAKRIRSRIIHGWAPSTRATYGSGLLLFHEFCDRRQVPEHLRAPAHHSLLEAFVAAMAGAYAATTLGNALAGVRAWHIAHRLPWAVEKSGMRTLMQAAKALAPLSSKRKERPPCTVDYLETAHRLLDLDSPKDAAVWACATSAFWSLAPLGELAVPSVLAYNPRRHVHPACVKQTHFDSEYFSSVTSIFIPFTKVDKHKGETVMWARQEGVSDPEAAYRNHIRINAPAENDHLFSYLIDGTHVPLSQATFLRRWHEIATASNLDPLTGHCFRIGGTLEYLLRGVPFDVIKTFGRWSSDAFQLYLRQHEKILAPYIQAQPPHAPSPRIQMPKVR